MSVCPSSDFLSPPSFLWPDEAEGGTILGFKLHSVEKERVGLCICLIFKKNHRLDGASPWSPPGSESSASRRHSSFLLQVPTGGFAHISIIFPRHQLQVHKAKKFAIYLLKFKNTLIKYIIRISTYLSHSNRYMEKYYPPVRQLHCLVKTFTNAP